MNTRDYIDSIRDGLVEYSNVSVTDDMIIRRLNAIYKRIYNHYARANPDLFSIPTTLTMVPGQQEYTIPRNIWSKRIHKVFMPYPTTQVRGYYEVEVVSHKDTWKYDLPAIRSTISSVASFYNNTLKFYPTPSTSLDAILYLTPRLAPLGRTVGTVLDWDDATKTITLAGGMDDGTIEDDLSTLLGGAYTNVISICDYYTGLIKHIYPVTTVGTDTLIIGAPTTRTTILDQTVEDATATTITDISVDDVITPGYTTGVSIFGDAFDEYLENYGILRIGNAYNELNSFLKEMFNDMDKNAKSDTAGRLPLQSITRVRSGIRVAGGFRGIR